MPRKDKYKDETDDDSNIDEQLYEKNKARQKDATRKQQRTRKNKYKDDRV
tara:strand:- start:370 stop:519 length:150 start_codon:yes stop_codon:yes gene_type:complete